MGVIHHHITPYNNGPSYNTHKTLKLGPLEMEDPRIVTAPEVLLQGEQSQINPREEFAESGGLPVHLFKDKQLGM
jgi:hypothetical protein